ncbi:TraM recognition domain-containing protein [Ferrimicrobium sp.]|uniref:type IV secretory system conjugative DNA transfer family protein n=1 Tax=Ferrimicrobium sp. TaxID=2926050 RepID=UPI002628429B|nr:TraM recognition domain-containing protein [Ferrimicrobium sp.]
MSARTDRDDPSSTGIGMLAPVPQRPNGDRNVDVALVAIAIAMLVMGALYGGALVSARISGHQVPHRLDGPINALAHPTDPSLAWRSPVGSPWVYWSAETFSLLLVAMMLYFGWRVLSPRAPRSEVASADPAQLEGMAERAHIAALAGPKVLLSQAGVLRPSIADAKPCDVGFYLGTSRGVDCWMGVRDSLVILGPPGSGKGLNLIIPSILDAPGAVITTSTRPDNLAVTLTRRGSDSRPVGVFDPQGLAIGAPSTLRWSPVRGCERAQTAMVRAKALCADSGRGVTEANFWQQQTQNAVRCMLHAAAIAGQPPSVLYEWSLSAAAARDAVAILSNHPRATPSWDRALDAIVSADPRQRDSVWSMVGNAFAPLADPRVLEAVSPAEGESFHPRDFLRDRGTLFLLGTASGASATAGLVSALIEDVVEVARRLAAASPGARLDPPLTLILDEAANYPLPSLGSLMSEGGGTGIPTMVVLQSLAQARDRWGSETAGAIWDSATAKVILGGSSNANDLADISRLVGEREVLESSQSYQSGSSSTGRSISTSIRRQSVLDPATIRTLKLGYGLLLYRASQPIMLTLRPWTRRHDAGQLQSDRSQVEALLRQGAGEILGDA